MRIRREKWRNPVTESEQVLVLGLLVIAIASPRLALCAALSWAFGLVFNAILRQKHTIVTLVMHANLAAVGAWIAFGRTWQPQLLGHLIAASAITYCAVLLLGRVAYFYGFPLLLLPSLFVGWMWQSSGSVISDWDGFSSVSVWWLGVATLVACLTVSRVFAWLFAVGTTLGLCFQSVLSSLPFNAILAMSDGLCFAFCASILISPSLRSMLWATFCVFLLNICWSLPLGDVTPLFLLLRTISVATVITILVVYASRVLSPPGLFWSWRFKPEAKIEDHWINWARFRTGEARTGLPFKGQWRVSQSFDGPWTHQGHWRHGLDFVVTNAQGKTFRNNGFELDDYYAFGQPVLAPSSGHVVAMVSSHPDNPIGAVSNQHNFGNYVIICDSYGAYILVGHLKQDSLTCSLYQYVQAGEVIGQCGNSGYSPEPHIHLHVQANALVGSPTLNFHLTHYLFGDEFCFHGVPTMGQDISRCEFDQNLSRRLSFEIGETFQIERSDSKMPALTIEACLDPVWGGMYFSDGLAKLYYSRDTSSFYFYHYEGPEQGPLFDLMTALPRLPLMFGRSCSYRDLPATLVGPLTRNKWRLYVGALLSSKVLVARATFQFSATLLEIHGKYGTGLATSCSLDPLDGFAKFSVGERFYEVKGRRDCLVVATIGSASLECEGKGLQLSV